ncbi:MAG: hypothetical protein MJ131_02640 [Lachnospiraceae bacterium]|nr:hypothetical protein [Lachnospiraceae bacterium]
MKYRFRRKMSQTTKKRIYISILFALVLMALGALSYYIIDKKRALEGIYSSKINELTSRINGGKRFVYKTLQSCRAGSILREDMVERTEILSDECSYVDESDFGKTLLVDVPAATVLDKLVVTGITADREVREVEYNCIDVTSNINAGDYIDVRIVYPNATDYVVMSKKMVKALTDTKLVVDLWVTEEELLLMDSAIVDASLYEGTRLYAVAYVLPTIQEAALVNYTPSEQIIELLKTDPNVVRRAAEKLSEELRRKRMKELELFIGKDERARYDRNGIYIGTPTDAELKAEELLSDDRVSAGELPKEYGAGLWDD